MDVKDAYVVLEECYPHNILQQLYRLKKFDGSETDTIEKHRYHARLLSKRAFEESDPAKKERLHAAADVFEKLYRKEFHAK